MKTELEAGEAAAVALFVVVVVHVVLTAAAVAVGILIRVTARRLLVFPIHHHGRRRGGSFDLRKEESISLIISSVSLFCFYCCYLSLSPPLSFLRVQHQNSRIVKAATAERVHSYHCRTSLEGAVHTK